jgi:[ribosomal protein S5]-alanine N-acetyltransferase
LKRSLSTSRLEMVPIEESHLDFLRTHWHRADVRKYMWDDDELAGDAIEKTVTQSDESFEREGWGIWLLLLDGEPIGEAGLSIEEMGFIELVYSLEPEHWGKGYATEAGAEVLRFAFEELELPVLYAGFDEANEASRKVMERLGMSYFDHLADPGETETYPYYFITRQTWLARPA